MSEAPVAESEMAESVFATDRSALASRGEAILDLVASNSTDAEWGEFLEGIFERAAATGDGPLALALLKAGAKGCHLHPAIRGGQPELVDKLLELGVSAVARDGSDRSDAPIHVAASSGQAAIVTTLLKLEDVDANEENGKGCTPMHLACLLSDDVPTVKALLGGGAKLGRRLGKTKAGFSPFELASRSGHQGIMGALREAGVAGNVRTSTDGEVLHRAAEENNVPMIEFLVVEAKTDVNFKDGKGASPLHAAAFNGCSAAMAALMKHGADLTAVNDYAETPLHAATQSGDVAAIELLCETHVGLNARFNASLNYGPEDDDWSALDVAASHGNVAAVKALVEAGADRRAVSAEGLTVMHSAAAGNNVEMIDTLVELGLDVKGAAGGTPVIHTAVQANSSDAVLALARHGADPNELNCLGENPLEASVQWGHSLSMTPTLLEAGATPLLQHVLHSEEFEELAHVFLERGAQLSTPDAQGQTVLHAAAAEYGADKIDFLISLGADVEAAPTLRQLTPLHVACCTRNSDAVASLLKNGARVDAEDIFGHTPLHLVARAAGLPRSFRLRPGTSARIAKMLLKAGASAESLNKSKHSPADIVLSSFPRSHPRFEDDVKPVLNLLLSPDMLWRRRGVWLLCRAYPGRGEVGPGGTQSGSTGVAESGSGTVGVDAEAVRGDTGSTGARGVAAKLLSVRDENVFRTIMCFL